MTRTGCSKTERCSKKRHRAKLDPKACGPLSRPMSWGQRRGKHRQQHQWVVGQNGCGDAPGTAARSHPLRPASAWGSKAGSPGVKFQGEQIAARSHPPLTGSSLTQREFLNFCVIPITPRVPVPVTKLLSSRLGEERYAGERTGCFIQPKAKTAC